MSAPVSSQGSGPTPRFITFTGIDAWTSPANCAAIAAKFPVEFAFLYSDDRDDPRYTGVPLLHEFQKRRVRTAFHLCGAAARRAIRENVYPAETLRADRIQLNLTDDEYDWDGLEKLARRRPVIRQTRDTKSWPLTPLDVAPLLDASGGRGVPISDFPDAPPAQLVGYAGGLGPDNVADFLDRLPAHPHGFWIDMETGVRTDDRFDLKKCLEVCRAVFKRDAA